MWSESNASKFIRSSSIASSCFVSDSLTVRFRLDWILNLTGIWNGIVICFVGCLRKIICFVGRLRKIICFVGRFWIIAFSPLTHQFRHNANFHLHSSSPLHYFPIVSLPVSRSSTTVVEIGTPSVLWVTLVTTNADLETMLSSK